MDYNLGLSYRREKNGPKAIKSFERSAQLGNSKSYFWIGDIYERGQIVEQNLAKAAEYYQKAFDAGWSSGASELGKLYLKGGPGLKKDEELGLKWWKKGAAQEDQNCLRELAWYYGANGKKTIRNGPLAAEYADRMMALGVKYFLYTGSAAAAYAENGQFDYAIYLQEQIVEFINKEYPEDKHRSYRAGFERDLEKFKRGESI